MNCCDNVHSWQSWPLPDGGGWQPAWPAGWTRAPNRRLAADLLITLPGCHVDVLLNFMPHRRGMAFDAVTAVTGPGIRAALARNIEQRQGLPDQEASQLAVQELVPGAGLPTRRPRRVHRQRLHPGRRAHTSPGNRSTGPQEAPRGLGDRKRTPTTTRAARGRQEPSGAPKPGRGGGPPGHRSHRRGPHPRTNPGRGPPWQPCRQPSKPSAAPKVIESTPSPQESRP